MVWVSLHSKEYMYFYQYPDTSKMVWKTRHFGARKLIFIIPSIYVWYDLFFFPLCLEKCCSFTVSVVFRVSNKAHSKLPSKVASRCWNQTVFFYVFEGNSETNACTWLSKVSLKTSGLLESLDLHCLIPVCQLTVLSQKKYMCLVPNRSQEWTLYFWLFGKNFCPLLSVAI